MQEHVLGNVHLDLFRRLPSKVFLYYNMILPCASCYLICCVVSLVWPFFLGGPYVVQAVLEFTVRIPPASQLLECWDDRYKPPHLGTCFLRFITDLFSLVPGMELTMSRFLGRFLCR